MKTEIAQFCEALLHTLAELGPPLVDAAGQIGERTELARPTSVLNEVRARLRSLSEKLANQHTHLLIFGPLKSGKSTLMNAIAGAYVSEVTSLPGYPALVFVQHASEPSFSVTRYNGRESVFADGRILNELIADSHVALVESIRAAELRGVEFDPRRHFPEAVRRIDVMRPVQSLAESGTVLVDTPGLYSRMNFSYDMLTREFRDSAACAVFVVKTDNLFLEQVFAEFNQLLDLFSRIFLVVNVDSGKRDLQPDGTLTPSAESETPQRIVEAFKKLSMAGPLREAFEHGRVRIHAIDLMNAASEVLTGTRRSEDAPVGGAAFEAFQRDLTDYLNSSDYTREFILDSLRQSSALCDEIVATCAAPEVAKLRDVHTAFAGEIATLDARLAACDRLLRIDWRATFGEARIANAQRSARAAQARVDELGPELEAALERWYGTGDSLKSLEHQYWNPILRNAGTAMSEEAVRRLQGALSNAVGGASPDPETMIDLGAIGLDLGPIGRAALPVLELTDSTEPYRIPIKRELVPVRKSIGDWLLLRSAASVAERLFGTDRTQEIPAEVKCWRLPEKSRAAFREVAKTALVEKFSDLPVKSAAHLLEHYVEKFCLGVTESLEQIRAEAARERDARLLPFEQLGQVAAVLQTLTEHVARVRGEIYALAEKENALPLVPAEPVPLAFPISESATPTIVRKDATA